MMIKTHISKITILLIILIVTMVSSNINWGKKNWTTILEADGKGYYAYLPAIFIYKDLNFSFFEELDKKKYYDENLFYDYRTMTNNGKIINKYYCGTAIAELPFFLISHSLSSLLNYDTDGYSKLYPIFVNVAAVFYLLIGLIFLNATLRTYNINEWHKSFALVAAVFGTNLFYYTVGEPSMSHVFSFAFINIFILYSRKFFSSSNIRIILILALTLGIIVLIRPINGLIIFILPFTAGSYLALKKALGVAINNKLIILLSFFVLICLISVQFIIYKLSTGHFFVYSYGKEGFNFLYPRMAAILFSYKKGLFLYTPMYLLAFTGCYFLWRKSKFEFFSFLLFFIFITYIFSSWWMWFYGGSFSSRVYVEFISLFMILFALTLKGIEKINLKRIYVSIALLLIIICQIQTYQYRCYAIHWSDMTKERYWDVFMRIDKLVK